MTSIQGKIENDWVERHLPMAWMLLISVGVIAIVWNQLFLPGFWDEAWSYLPAVEAMAHKGPGLLPGAIDAELYKGHPLLFFFTYSLWLQIIPALWWAKLLTLLFSLALLWQVYFTGRWLGNQWTGMWAAGALAAFGLFLSQATMVLPETMLAFLAFRGVDRYLRGKHLSASLYLTAAVLTKESAIVLAAAVGLHFLLEAIYSRKDFKKSSFLRPLFYYLLPAIFYGLFLLLQHLKYGWWLYPDHVHRMELSLHTYFARMKSFLSYSFMQNGFLLLSLLFVLAMFRLFQTKDRLNLRFFTLITLLLFLFWSFSAVNFFSLRYLLLTFPFLLLFLIYPVTIAIRNKVLLTILMFLSIALIAGSSYVERMSKGTIWHVDPVEVQKAAIDTLKTMAGQDDLILTGFLMKENLTLVPPGYLKEENLFRNVEVYPIDSAKWLIISNIENEPWMNQMVDTQRTKPVWQMQRNHAWVKIYPLR